MKLRITNLNVENFGLGRDKPRWDDFQDKQEFYRVRASFWEAAVSVAEEIVKELLDKAEKPSDIFVFQEFDVAAPAGKRAIELFFEHGYKPIYPDQETIISASYSITMMFVKEQLQAIPCASPKIKEWKWCITQISDLTVVGIHAPGGQAFLDKLQEYAQKNREQKLIIIGDFNIATNILRVQEEIRPMYDALKGKNLTAKDKNDT